MLQQIFMEPFSISTQVLEHKVPSEILFCIFLKQVRSSDLLDPQKFRKKRIHKVSTFFLIFC